MAGSAYIELLRKRQIQVVVASALMMGLSAGVPLAIVLMVQHETGSFASAGVVTAAMAVAAAIFGPLQGRLVDRVGHTRTLPVFGAIGTTFTVGLVVATVEGASLGVLVGLAALVGATNASVFPAMRALWADLVDHPGQLNSAYAIHAVLMEAFFISGPILAALLIAFASPAAAVLVITLVKFAGLLAFSATPASRAWRGEPHTGGRLGALASPGMRTMLLADVPFGAMFGVIDVAVPAFAKSEGTTAAAGLLLAALAVGSMIGGVVYGSRPRPVNGSRYAVIAGVQALLVLPLALAGTIPMLAIAMALAGLLVAPLGTVGFGLTDVVAPAGTLTEASSWVLTAYQFGLAGGTAAAGAIVEGPGTTTAFLTAAGCAGASAVVLWLRRQTMAGRPVTATAS